MMQSESKLPNIELTFSFPNQTSVILTWRRQTILLVQGRPLNGKDLKLSKIQSSLPNRWKKGRLI